MSKEETENLKEIGTDKIKQVVYKGVINNETITIGIYFRNGNYSQQKVQKNILEQLDTIYEEQKDNLSEKPRADDLSVYYYEFQSPPNNNLEKLRKDNDVNKVYCLTEKNLNINLSKNQYSNSSINSVAPINGSKHLLDTFGIVNWYNCLNGSLSECATSISSPHAGDGNNRFDCGYHWYPNDVSVNLQKRRWQGTKISSVQLFYEYGDNLNNLQVDSNEALEMEVWFYNFYKEEDESKRGHSFMPTDEDSEITWASNQPNAYLDTKLFDSYEVDAYSVGTDDANQLIANKSYYWQITASGFGINDGCANDGRCCIVAQRSYRYLLSGAYGVFSEEHEPMRKLGLIGDQNWYSESIYDMGTDPELVDSSIPIAALNIGYIYKDGVDGIEVEGMEIN